MRRHWREKYRPSQPRKKLGNIATRREVRDRKDLWDKLRIALSPVGTALAGIALGISWQQTDIMSRQLQADSSNSAFVGMIKSVDALCAHQVINDMNSAEYITPYPSTGAWDVLLDDLLDSISLLQISVNETKERELKNLRSQIWLNARNVGLWVMKGKPEYQHENWNEAIGKASFSMRWFCYETRESMLGWYKRDEALLWPPVFP